MASFVSDDLFEHHSNSTPKRGLKPSAAKKSYVLSSPHEKVQPEVRHNVATAQPSAAFQANPELRTLVGQIREPGKSATSLRTPARTKQDSAQLWLPTFAEQRFKEVALDGVKKGDVQLFQTILDCIVGTQATTINRHPIANAHQKLSTILRRLPTQDELKLYNPTWEQMDRGQFNKKVNKLSLKFTPGTLYNMMQSLREEGVTSLSRIRARLKRCKAAKDLLDVDDDELLAHCELFGLKFAIEVSVKAHCRIVKSAKNAREHVFDQLPSYVHEKLGPQLSQVIHEIWEDIATLPA